MINTNENQAASVLLNNAAGRTNAHLVLQNQSGEVETSRSESNESSRTVTSDSISNEGDSDENMQLAGSRGRQLTRQSEFENQIRQKGGHPAALQVLTKSQSERLDRDEVQYGQKLFNVSQVGRLRVQTSFPVSCAKNTEKSASSNDFRAQYRSSAEDPALEKIERPRKKYIKKKLTGFSEQLDEQLLDLVKEFGESSWNRISKTLGKSEIKCHKRFLELTNRNHMVSASWSKNEDELLTKLVLSNGAKDWTKIAALLPGRIGKQCRERWHHHLNPNVVKRKWTIEEDMLIIKLYLKFNSRWSEMAKHIDGRTDNQIKNRYNSNLKKRLYDKDFTSMLAQAFELPTNKAGERDNSVDSVTFDDSKPAQKFTPIVANLASPTDQKVKNDDNLVFSCKTRRISKFNFKRAQMSNQSSSDEQQNSPTSARLGAVAVKHIMPPTMASYTTPQPKPCVQRTKAMLGNTGIDECIPQGSTSRISTHWTRTSTVLDTTEQNFSMAIAKDQTMAFSSEKRARTGVTTSRVTGKNDETQETGSNSSKFSCFSPLDKILAGEENSNGSTASAVTIEENFKVLAFQSHTNSQLAYCIPVWTQE